MEMIYVKPAAGGRVRQPERKFRVMPSEGAFVPRDAHYERLLATGDVTKCKAPAPKSTPATAAAPEKSKQSSGESVRASADQKE